MSTKFDLHGKSVEFEKNQGKSIIGLELEDGEEECFLIDIFSIDDSDYIALVSRDSDELYIFKYSEDDEDGLNLLSLEDEEELDEVYHLFSHYWDDDAIENIINEYMEDLEENDEL